MKLTKPFLFSFAIAILIIVYSCKKDNDGPSAKPVRYITEKDTFNTDVIWYPDTIYCIKTAVSVKGTLTIRPGTIIKLSQLSSLSADDYVAVGTKEEPIVFTSVYDDEHGGDTDGDKGVITPKEGSWNNIGFLDSFSARFEYCEFYYGGCLLILPLMNATVKNCIFAHNNGMFIEVNMLDYALFIYNVGIIPNINYSFECSNNLFYDNKKPLGLAFPASIDSTNTFSFEGTGNKMNGIFIYAKAADFNKQIEWNETEVPFVLPKDFEITDGGRVEFSDGVIVKCDKDVKISIASGGSLNSNGKEVIFTSLKDDEHGGDTNGDGTATLPQDGDWQGINNAYLISSWWSGPNILYDEIHNPIILP